MAKLGEFIGALLSDAAQARVRADMEALKIAEAYSAHELLKHLPVPRFRLPDITVDIPVLVSAVEGAPASSTDRPFDEPSRDDLTKIAIGGLSDSGIQLSAALEKRATSAVALYAKRIFESGPQYLLSPARVSGELAATLVKEVRAGLKEKDPAFDKLGALEVATRESFKALLLARMVKAPSLQVSVAAGDIKAHADNESVMRVRLTITEDAYEIINRDEGQGFSLSPE
jgi:hypothetical protein